MGNGTSREVPGHHRTHRPGICRGTSREIPRITDLLCMGSGTSRKSWDIPGLTDLGFEGGPVGKSLNAQTGSGTGRSPGTSLDSQTWGSGTSREDSETWDSVCMGSGTKKEVLGHQRYVYGQERQ